MTTPQDTERVAFLAWFERECDEDPMLETPEARVLAWRAWQANAGANMGNSQVSAVKLPDPAGYANHGQLLHIADGYAYLYPIDMPGVTAPMYTETQVLALLSSAGLVPAQDSKE